MKERNKFNRVHLVNPLELSVIEVMFFPVTVSGDKRTTMPSIYTDRNFLPPRGVSMIEGDVYDRGGLLPCRASLALIPSLYNCLSSPTIK